MSANKVTLNPNWKVGTTAGSITNTNAGNVGIGNTTPVASLDVSGTVYLRGADANQGLFINSSGNVGIGTTSPGYKLDVSGSINASGFLSAGGEYSYFGRSSGGVAANFFGNSGATSQTILKIREPAGQTGNIFSWETNTPTTLGVIDASGNMGIGYASPGTAKLAINGNVGIGTTVPTNLLSLGSEAARTFWIERRNTVNNAGSNLIVEAGGSTNGMVSTVAVVEAGTGYNVNDVLTLALPSGGTCITGQNA